MADVVKLEDPADRFWSQVEESVRVLTFRASAPAGLARVACQNARRRLDMVGGTIQKVDIPQKFADLASDPEFRDIIHRATSPIVAALVFAEMELHLAAGNADPSDASGHSKE